MRHTTLLAAAAALLIAPAAAMAEGLNYNYLDLRYFSSDSDALTVNLKGGLLSGSVGIGSVLYVIGDAVYAETDDANVGTGDGSFRVAQGTLRVGAHLPLTPVLDVVGNVGGIYVDTKGKGAFKGNKDNDTGYLGELGLRLALIPQVEVGAFYGYQDVSNSTESSFTGDLQYHVTSNISLVTSAQFAKSRDFYSFGARYYF